MNLLLKTIEKVLPKANIRTHDFSDVQNIARREKIRLIIADYQPDILGYYTTRKTKSSVKKFIMINSRIQNPIDRTFVGLHELGHHFLHAPVSWRVPFYCRRCVEVTKSKFDFEADAFALIALVPRWLLFEMQHTCFSSIAPEMLPFLVRRQKLWETHGI